MNTTVWIGLGLFLLLGQTGAELGSEPLVWVAAVVYTIGLSPLFKQLLTSWSDGDIMSPSTEERATQ